MSSFKLLLAEIRFRKLNFLLSVMAVMVAAMLFVAGPMLVESYGRQTDRIIAEHQQKTARQLAAMDKDVTRLLRDMGFNLMIVNKDTNMADFWASDYAAKGMPEQYVDRLAHTRELTLVTHLVATLQQKVKWNGRTALLVGYRPEATQAHLRKKKPMGYLVEPGTVYLGHELGLGHQPGETVEILGKSFKIARILPEQGSKEDITMAMALKDAQRLLKQPGRVNQIMALGCRCSGERLPQVRRQLAAALPDTKVTEFRSIAVARAETRDLVAAESEKFLTDLSASRAGVQTTLASLASVFTPVIVLVSAVWVGLLALANVRQRRNEIGLLRALGKGTALIAALLLGKAVLVGLTGGVIGFLAGTWLVRTVGLPALGVTADNFHVAYNLLLWTVLGAPLVSLLAAYLPTLLALVQHPAVVLRDV